MSIVIKSAILQFSLSNVYNIKDTIIRKLIFTCSHVPHRWSLSILSRPTKYEVPPSIHLALLRVVQKLDHQSMNETHKIHFSKTYEENDNFLNKEVKSDTESS